MGVVADMHAVGLDLLGQLGQELGGILDCLGRAKVLVVVQVRYVKELVAERFVELDSPLEVVAQQGIETRVRTATLKPALIQHLAELLGIAAVVAGELHGLIAQFSHGRECAGQVFAAIVSQRVELQANGNLLARIGKGWQRTTARGIKGGSPGPNFQHVASGNVHLILRKKLADK